MATIVTVSPASQPGKFAVGPTVLTGADTLVYNAGKRQVLYLYNTTASAVTVKIGGNGATTIAPSGYGGTIDVSAGYSIAVAAGTVQAVALNNIRSFLTGTVAVTGGVTGVMAWIQQD